MARQQKVERVLIIGLGQFGLELAKQLQAREVDVQGVENDEERIEIALSDLDNVKALDATMERNLMLLEPATYDVCVCAIGERDIEASVKVTTLLCEANGTHRVIARCASPLHKRILLKVGAQETVYPEEAYGKFFAQHLISHPPQKDGPIGEELMVRAVRVPRPLVGRRLETLLRPEARVNIVGLRNDECPDPYATPPREDHSLQSGDLLMLTGMPADLDSFVQQLGSEDE